MAAALAAHDQIFRQVTAKNSGAVFKTVGDAFCCAFARPVDALVASIDAQRELAAYSWPPETGEVRVRMGIHTGTAIERDGDYFGPTLNRVARLMSVAHGGQIVLSAATASLLQSSTPKGVSFIDLGLHRLKDLSQPEHTYQVAGDGLRAEFPPLHSLDVVANNLPIQLTSFIGRDKELYELKGRLAEHRLITLTGPGGIGKTRLSLQLAAEECASYKDGCWFVSLAGVEQNDLVPYVVATAVGAQETPGQPILETLKREIGDKRVLLVVDNAEHLVPEVAALVRELLLGCGHIAIIVTSREAIHVAGEQVVRISPMPRTDGERLLIERARGLRGAFRVSESDKAAWNDLLQKLEGIPLAIELAAARLSAFTVTQIDERLSSRLGLASRDTTGSTRQRTLRSTIDWSYQLLRAEEKKAFAHLSVFEGNFTLEASEAVLRSADIEEIEGALHSLVEKSFVVTELEGDNPFYVLLEVMREFGLEQLVALGELDRASRAHCNYYLSMADAAETLNPKQRGSWLDKVEIEIGNVRAALMWSLTNVPETAAKLAVEFSAYWQMRSHFTEGRSWLQRVVESETSLPAAKLAPLLDRAAVFATVQDDYVAARDLSLRSCELYRGLNDARGLGRCVHALAVIEHRSSNTEEAREQYLQSVKILRDAGEDRLLSIALANLASLESEVGNLARAEELLEESLRLAEPLGDATITSSILLSFATLEARRNDLERAESYLVRGLAAKRELRNPVDIADALANLASVAARQQKPDEARGHAREAMRIAVELQLRTLTLKVLEAFVQIALSERDYRAGARLLGLSESLGNEAGIGTSVENRSASRTIRDHLSEEEFHFLNSEGAASRISDALVTLLN
jgi:predicted ATPase